jgi:hypothetical protein
VVGEGQRRAICDGFIAPGTQRLRPALPVHDMPFVEYLAIGKRLGFLSWPPTVVEPMRDPGSIPLTPPMRRSFGWRERGQHLGACARSSGARPARRVSARG